MDRIEHYAFDCKIVATLTDNGWTHEVYARDKSGKDWEKKPFANGVNTLAEARAIARAGDAAKGLAALTKAHPPKPDAELTVKPELEGEK